MDSEIQLQLPNGQVKVFPDRQSASDYLQSIDDKINALLQNQAALESEAADGQSYASLGQFGSMLEATKATTDAVVEISGNLSPAAANVAGFYNAADGLVSAGWGVGGAIAGRPADQNMDHVGNFLQQTGDILGDVPGYGAMGNLSDVANVASGVKDAADAVQSGDTGNIIGSISNLAATAFNNQGQAAINWANQLIKSDRDIAEAQDLKSQLQNTVASNRIQTNQLITHYQNQKQQLQQRLHQQPTNAGVTTSGGQSISDMENDSSQSSGEADSHADSANSAARRAQSAARRAAAARARMQAMVSRGYG